MKYYNDNKQALSELISDLENDNGILIIAKQDVESELDYANKCHKLEEQLGCPLEVVFKALKDGIYTKESESDNELELFEVRGIEKKGVGVISKFCSYAECDFTCYYEDYKKTWWLKKDKSE